MDIARENRIREMVDRQGPSPTAPEAIEALRETLAEVDGLRARLDTLLRGLVVADQIYVMAEDRRQKYWAMKRLMRALDLLYGPDQPQPVLEWRATRPKIVPGIDVEKFLDDAATSAEDVGIYETWW